MDLLAAYLKRAGFLEEAALAERAQQDPEARRHLEERVHEGLNRLPISRDLAVMEQVIKLLFGQAADMIRRPVLVGRPPRRAMLVMLRSLADRNLVQRTLEAMGDVAEDTEVPDAPEPLVDWLAFRRATDASVQIQGELAQAVKAVLSGQAVLFIHGAARIICIGESGYPYRSIAEPETESVIRGPREGLTEDYETNLSLIRRRLRTPRLCIETMQIGEVSNTRVGLLYIRGICKQSLLEEVRRRLGRIKTDGILESAYIEEFIEDTPWTLFPTHKATERPDVVVAGLMEGRFAILVDGTPFALIAPTFLVDMLQAPDDYYDRYPIALAIRTLRWTFATVAMLGPALYVALTTFHQEMIPTQLLLSILASREGVAFPAVVEALGMEVAFEALREAGVRLPRPVGQAVSIVGALVIGQAAVQAGIVSPIMVIVVALTGISSFVVPKVSAAIALRMLRFPLLILASIFGAYGITIGWLCIVIHLLGLRSFGAPYLAPLGPLLPLDHKDVLFRAPHWANRHRPSGSEALDPTTTAKGLAPGPQQGKEDRT